MIRFALLLLTLSATHAWANLPPDMSLEDLRLAEENSPYIYQSGEYVSTKSTVLMPRGLYKNRAIIDADNVEPLEIFEGRRFTVVVKRDFILLRPVGTHTFYYFDRQDLTDRGFRFVSRDFGLPERKLER